MLATHTAELNKAALATSGAGNSTMQAYIKAHPQYSLVWQRLDYQQQDNIAGLVEAGLSELAGDLLDSMPAPAALPTLEQDTEDRWIVLYDSTDQTPEVIDFKGNELLKISSVIGKYGFSFGQRKAEALLDDINNIERFVVTNGDDNPAPGDRSDRVLMVKVSRGKTFYGWPITPAQATAIWQHRAAIAHFVHMRATDAQLAYSAAQVDKLNPPSTPGTDAPTAYYINPRTMPLMLSAGQTRIARQADVMGRREARRRGAVAVSYNRARAARAPLYLATGPVIALAPPIAPTTNDLIRSFVYDHHTMTYTLHSLADMLSDWRNELPARSRNHTDWTDADWALILAEELASIIAQARMSSIHDHYFLSASAADWRMFGRMMRQAGIGWTRRAVMDWAKDYFAAQVDAFTKTQTQDTPPPAPAEGDTLFEMPALVPVLESAPIPDSATYTDEGGRSDTLFPTGEYIARPVDRVKEYRQAQASGEPCICPPDALDNHQYNILCPLFLDGTHTGHGAPSKQQPTPTPEEPGIRYTIDERLHIRPSTALYDLLDACQCDTCRAELIRRGHVYECAGCGAEKVTSQDLEGRPHEIQTNDADTLADAEFKLCAPNGPCWYPITPGTDAPDDDPPPTPDPDDVDRYEARQEARIARYRTYAANARQRSDARFKSSDDITRMIPMGQPILVGHHSESRHRNALKRSDNHMRNGIKEAKKAAYWTRRANRAENNPDIFKDDPDALRKLQEKIDRARTAQDTMKACNKIVKGKGTDAEKIDALTTQGLTANDAAALLVPDYAGRVGFAPYALRNNNSNIRRMVKRMEDLTRLHGRPDFDAMIDGVRVVEEPDYQSTNLYFPGKPSDALRDALKRYSFRWGRQTKAWYVKDRSEYILMVAVNLAHWYAHE